MTRSLTRAKSFACPAVLLVIVWLGVLLTTIAGPIKYPEQPSLSTLLIVVIGIVLFVAGHGAGGKLAQCTIGRFSQAASTSPKLLSRAVTATAILGIFGIVSIAVERTMLNLGLSADYAAFLRCAPEFVDYIEVRRTPLIYIGYATFSFGFVSLALFLLRAEELRGWPAYLAQTSIVVPVGYALLYSGRMPIFLMLTCLAGIAMVRLYEGRSLVPRGHLLALKTVIFIIAFVAYSNAMWANRRNFCTQLETVVRDLRQELVAKREAAQRVAMLAAQKSEATQEAARRAAQAAEAARRAAEEAEAARKLAPDPEAARKLAEKAETALIAAQQATELEISAENAAQLAAREASRVMEPSSLAGQEKIATGALTRMIDSAKHVKPSDDLNPGEMHAHYVSAVMKEAWGVRPQSYLINAIDTGIISPQASMVLMSNYFYLTHSVMIIDRIWQGRDRLAPVWGIYEIGVLSPAIRVFFPQSTILQRMHRQLKQTNTYGFFPSAWGAALVDFGKLGGSLYILLWGLLGGWAYAACRCTEWVTPPLLLSFVLATVLLSPLEGPLGTANSALVLGSIIVVGLLLDLPALRRRAALD